MKNKHKFKSTSKILLGFIILSICFSSKINCQIFNLYWTDYTSFNPAGSGLFYNCQGTTMLRLQENIGGETPYNFYNSFNAKVEKLHGGMGLSYYKSEFFDFTQHGFNIKYSYHIKISHKCALGLGIASVYRYSYNDMVYISPVDDDVISNQFPRKFNDYGVDFGLVLKSEKLEAGYSYNRLIKESDLENYNIHIGFLNYNFKISDLLKVSPGVLYYFNKYHSYTYKLLNVNLKIIFKDRFWFYGFHRDSIDYPSDDKWFGLGVGYDIKGKFRLGYSKYFASKEGYSSTEDFLISVIIK